MRSDPSRPISGRVDNLSKHSKSLLSFENLGRSSPLCLYTEYTNAGKGAKPGKPGGSAYAIWQILRNLFKVPRCIDCNDAGIHRAHLLHKCQALIEVITRPITGLRALDVFKSLTRWC